MMDNFKRKDTADSDYSMHFSSLSKLGDTFHCSNATGDSGYARCPMCAGTHFGQIYFILFYLVDAFMQIGNVLYLMMLNSGIATVSTKAFQKKTS